MPSRIATSHDALEMSIFTPSRLSAMRPISAVRTGLVISQKPTFADPSTSVKGGVQRIVSVHGGIAPSARRRAAWTLVETPADTLQKVCSDQLHPPPQVDRSGAPARSATSCWACGNLLPGQI